MTVDEYEIFTAYAKGRGLGLGRFACSAMKAEIRKRVRDKYWLRQTPKDIIPMVERIFADPVEDDGYVYFIRDGEYMKIGYSTDVQQRMKSLITANPRDIELIAVFPGSTKTERELHSAFAYCRHRGEWFHIDPKMYDIINVVREQINSVLSGWTAKERYYRRLDNYWGKM